MKATGARQQPLDLGFGQSLALECDFHLEVEQRIRPDSGRRLASDFRRHRRPRRPAGPPCARYANDDTGRLDQRQVLQELQRFPRRPSQWMEDLARIDHRLEPPALFRRALHRQE